MTRDRTPVVESEQAVRESGEAVREKEEEDLEVEARQEKERLQRLRRAHAIASELLDTEKHYVAVLHLIDQVGVSFPVLCITP